jgi:ribosomal protein S4
MTLQEFCFKHKIVTGGAELRRLLILNQIKVNSVVVDNAEIEIKNGDMIQKGRKQVWIKAATMQNGINIMPKDLSGNKTYRIITDQADYSIVT